MTHLLAHDHRAPLALGVEWELLEVRALAQLDCPNSHLHDYLDYYGRCLLNYKTHNLVVHYTTPLVHPLLVNPLLVNPLLVQPLVHLLLVHPLLVHQFLAHQFLAHQFLVHQFLVHQFLARAR
jgi:hypothetical protein